MIDAGYLLEDLERKGLDAKSYIQTMLRRTEGSSKEEQIIQKEQILAELQRVEKELQVVVTFTGLARSQYGQDHIYGHSYGHGYGHVQDNCNGHYCQFPFTIP